MVERSHREIEGCRWSGLEGTLCVRRGWGLSRRSMGGRRGERGESWLFLRCVEGAYSGWGVVEW